MDIAREAHGFYDLELKEADAVIAEVKRAVATWREEAERLRIPRSAQDEMAGAFEV